MLFNSLTFIFIFLPVVFLVFIVLERFKLYKSALFWLTISSFYFYGYWQPKYILLIVGSIICNYTLSRVINTGVYYRRIILIIGVAGNLSLLGYFKYTDFLISSISSVVDLNISGQNIILPLAISFFTFQQIAYLVDVYRGLVKEHNFLNYCLFVTFFPQLLAGPIVHHSEMMPQFLGKYKLINYDLISKGIFIFCIGLFKKIVVADFFGTWADIGFADVSVLTTTQAWITSFSYTFQIYFDFSGYTDMAIGIALIFGIQLPENFNSPYKAKNIIDFWRRWHITLSRFLRDYLYIPLGGNRKGLFLKGINIMVTMVLGGLWHGASYTFIIWGFLHGTYLLINHLWVYISNLNLAFVSKNNSPLGSYISHVITFIAVVFAWIFFRAASVSDACIVVKKLFNTSQAVSYSFSFVDIENYFKNDQISFAQYLFINPDGQLICMFFLIIAYLVVIFFKNSNQLVEIFLPTLSKAAFVAITLVILITLNVYMVTPNDFLYYRF